MLEVLHVALGLVRSGLGTTLAQVASRLVMVWGILLQFPQVQPSPIFSTMVLAWCIAEIVRYATYALALYDVKIYALEWLRYTLFYVLYPLGAGSEAYLIYSSIPWAKYRYGHPGMQATMVLFLIWPPGESHPLITTDCTTRRLTDCSPRPPRSLVPAALLSMMSHMHAQRKKHIRGRGKAGLAQAKKAQ